MTAITKIKMKSTSILMILVMLAVTYLPATHSHAGVSNQSSAPEQEKTAQEHEQFTNKQENSQNSSNKQAVNSQPATDENPEEKEKANLNQNTEQKSEWSASKVIGTIIAIPLIPIVLSFEVLAGIAKKLPESTSMFAGDIVRGAIKK